MKRITLLHYRLDRGGIDRVAALLASGFATAGHDVTLLLFCSGGAAEDIYRADMDDRVKIEYLGTSKSNRTGDLIRLLPRAARWIKANPNDILLSTCNHMNWITLAAARIAKTNAKVVFKTTNPIIRKSDTGLYAKLRKWGYNSAFKAADMTLTLSIAERDQLRSIFSKAPDKFESVINPYVSDAMLSRPDTKPMIANIPNHRANGQKIILCIGRFEPQKNMELLIQSFAALTRNDCHLVILGDGALKTQCENLASQLGVSNHIIMPGFFPDVSDYLHAADLYIMTSRYEGLPAVILEALAAGLPTLTTDCFLAAREIIEPLDGCAILERDDPQYIADMIVQALNTQVSDGTDLRDAARAYSIANGIADHIAKINSL